MQNLMDVTPSNGLSDGDQVTVSGMGWSPNATLDVAQCAVANSSPDDCDWTTATTVQTDAQGSFTTPFTVHEVINTVNEPGTDCRLTACYIGVAADFLAQFAFQAISFEPGTLMPTPDSGLVDGQSVALNGSGWPAGATVYVLQCRLDQGLSLSACDTDTRQDYIAAPDGSVIDDFAVSQNLATGSGAFDCAAVPDSCGIGAVVWENFGSGVPAMIDAPSNHVINFGDGDTTNPPQSKGDCKKGGWQSLTDDEGTPFKNQGDCVSYVATGGTNKAKG